MAGPDKDKDKGTAGRADGSLGKLTKSFVALVQKAPNGVIDLNNAAAELDVRVREHFCLELFRTTPAQWPGP
eukprot:2286170-Rhodomonas_salina.2